MGRLRGALGVSAAALVLLGAAACGRGGSGSITGPTVPPGDDVSTTSSVPSTTTTAEAAVSYEVPATIDQAYVQRVVSAYDKVLGDAIRVAVAEQKVTEDFLKYLVAIYHEDEVEFQQSLWLEPANDGTLFARSSPHPGDPVTTVVSVERADVTCIIVRAERDFAPTLKSGESQPESPQDDYIVLRPKPPGRDPLAANPTPWVMAFDGFKKDNTVPVEACA